MTGLKAFLKELKDLFDHVASIPGGEVRTELVFVVGVLSGLGFLHVTNAAAFDDSLYALVVAILSGGVAIERIVSALNGQK